MSYKEGLCQIVGNLNPHFLHLGVFYLFVKKYESLKEIKMSSINLQVSFIEVLNEAPF